MINYISKLRVLPDISDDETTIGSNREGFRMPLARLNRLISRRGAASAEKAVVATESPRVSLGAAAMPPGIRAYVIGDIHGRDDLLEDLLARIAAHRAEHDHVESQVIFLGDYIDRGPMSAEVVDRVLDLSRDGGRVITLKGNHEQAMMAFLQDPMKGKRWLHYGGDATLRSYGVEVDLANLNEHAIDRISRSFRKKLPEAHLQFFGTLVNSYTLGDYHFVHAGVDPASPLDEQREHDMLWIRDSFLNHTGLYEKVIVHGHSINPEPEFLDNRIGIDTGAFYSNVLTCLVLEGDRKEIL